MPRRILVVLAALVAVLVAPSAVGAQSKSFPIVGVGEQQPGIFHNEYFSQLGLHDVRIVVGWDATSTKWQIDELDPFMAAARDTKTNVLVSFGRSRVPKRNRMLPSVKQYRHAFRAFRKRYPWVKQFIVWNEANHCSQPVCHKPERAAAYYNLVTQVCPSCTFVAADVLDTDDMVPWIQRFNAAARPGPKIWGLHNYIDANRFRTRGTKALLRAVKGDIWFTETGGIVKRVNPDKVPLPESTRHAAKATSYVFKLAALSKRVKRVYFYHWSPAPTPFPTWDSALVDKHDRPRVAYDILYKWLLRHGVAS